MPAASCFASRSSSSARSRSCSRRRSSFSKNSSRISSRRRRPSAVELRVLEKGVDQRRLPEQPHLVDDQRFLRRPRHVTGQAQQRVVGRRAVADDPLDDEVVFDVPADDVQLRLGRVAFVDEAGHVVRRDRRERLEPPGGPMSGSTSETTASRARSRSSLSSGSRPRAAKARNSRGASGDRTIESRSWDSIVAGVSGSAKGEVTASPDASSASGARAAGRSRTTWPAPPSGSSGRPSTVTRTPPALPSVSRNPSAPRTLLGAAPAHARKNRRAVRRSHLGPRILLELEDHRDAGGLGRLPRRVFRIAGAGPGDTATFLKVTGATRRCAIGVARACAARAARSGRERGGSP